MKKEVLSLDLDGVVLKPRTPSFQWQAVKVLVSPEYRRYGIRIDLGPFLIPTFDHDGIQNYPLQKSSRLAILTHFFHRVSPEICQTLDQLQDLAIIINTGRPCHPDWVNLTIKQLETGDILRRVTKIYFKPQGVPTYLSKLSVAAQLYDQGFTVTHVDDNPADSLPIAKRFPSSQVILIQNWSTNYFFKKTDPLPNLKIIKNFRELIKIL